VRAAGAVPAALALLCAAAMPAHAVRPDEMLANPQLEARARAISAELRCMVCQNQSIDDSDADLAHDLRVLVRERLTAGEPTRRRSTSSSRATASSFCSSRASAPATRCCGARRC